MAIELTVNNNTYDYPSPGDEPGWGESATGWAEAVTEVLAETVNVDDILQTSFNIANNITSSSNVTNLLFNPSTVRSAQITYSIYIHTSTTELCETGTLYATYKNGGTVGSKWSIGRVAYADDAGIRFTMTDSGQVQYTSSNVSGTTYTGVMKFYAKTTQQ